MSDLDYDALGVREADCGCCKVVDSVGLQRLLDLAQRTEALEVALWDAIDELTECRSFIAVETRHYPTARGINHKIAELRAALDREEDQ